MKRAEKSKEKQRRGKPFKKGQSGNLSGRPRGSKNYKTLAFEERLESLGCDPVARRLRSQDILKQLGYLFIYRGLPGFIRSDFDIIASLFPFVTRGKKLVIIIGQQRALKISVQKKTVTASFDKFG